jgi:hypothetical protein
MSAVEERSIGAQVPGELRKIAAGALLHFFFCEKILA